MTTNTKRGNNKNSVMVFLQVAFVPLLFIAPIAAILIWALGLDPSEQLTRGILYGCLFLACIAIGRWKFSLKATGITSENIGRSLLYAGIILVTSYAFIFAAQPPKGLADVGLAIWSPILFYLAVALAEETWFRGLIFKALNDWRGSLLAIFGSALIFGLMHAPTMGWRGLAFSISMGLPYAIVRLKTGNILSLIVIHWLTNLADSFIHLSTTSLDIVWLALMYILVFPGVSLFILLLDRRLRGREYVSP